jgi:hypothetical protein
MNNFSSEKVRLLEERLVTEVRVTSTLYDMDLHTYAEWAAGHIEPLEFAQAHAVGWMQGRARAVRLIARLLKELRTATDDDERQWQERLLRLGVTRERLVSTF